MSTAVTTISRAVRQNRREQPVVRPVRWRAGTAADAPKIFALIEESAASARLLPRSEEELRQHASRFTVATRKGEVVACAELAPLGADVAEVRSLVVDPAFRRRGLASELVARLRRRAAGAGFRRLCAFAHEPEQFLQWGFTIVAHSEVPEKIATDCTGCRLFGACGQYGLVQSLIATPVAHTRARKVH